MKYSMFSYGYATVGGFVVRSEDPEARIIEPLFQSVLRSGNVPTAVGFIGHTERAGRWWVIAKNANASDYRGLFCATDFYEQYDFNPYSVAAELLQTGLDPDDLSGIEARVVAPEVRGLVLVRDNPSYAKYLEYACACFLAVPSGQRLKTYWSLLPRSVGPQDSPRSLFAAESTCEPPPDEWNHLFPPFWGVSRFLPLLPSAANEPADDTEPATAGDGPQPGPPPPTLSEVREVLTEGLARQSAELRNEFIARTDSVRETADRASRQVDTLAGQLSDLVATVSALARRPVEPPDALLQKTVASVRDEVAELAATVTEELRRLAARTDQAERAAASSAAAAKELSQRLANLDSRVEQTKETADALKQQLAAPRRGPWSAAALWILGSLVGSAVVFAAGWYVARSLDKDLVARDGLDKVITEKGLVARDELNNRFAAASEREKQFLTQDKLKDSLAKYTGDEQVILRAELEKRLNALLAEPTIESSRKRGELLASVLAEAPYSGELTFPRMSQTESPSWAIWLKRTNRMEFQSRYLHLTSTKITANTPESWAAELLKPQNVAISYKGKGGDLARCVLGFTLDLGKEEKNTSGAEYVIVVTLYGRSDGDWRVVTLGLEPKPAKSR